MLVATVAGGYQYEIISTVKCGEEMKGAYLSVDGEKKYFDITKIIGVEVRNER